ncbi:MAG: hypothetical protein HYU36_22265 [Planctomycetes bacterium]|nr:hypothetical protein [Planctomycetota bacterium]
MADPIRCECGKEYSQDSVSRGPKVKCPYCGRERPVREAPPTPAGAVASPQARPAAAPGACPSCGAAIAPGAVLCVQCGYHILRGQKVGGGSAPSSKAEAATAAETDEDEVVIPLWPKIVAAVLAVLVLAWAGLALRSGYLYTPMEGYVAPVVKVREFELDEDQAASEAAKKIASRLGDVPHFFSRYCSRLADQPQKTARTKEIALEKIIERLPDDVDPGCLLEIPKERDLAFRAATGWLIPRVSTAWLLEKSCRSSAGGRLLCATALRHSFPYHELDEKGVGQLAQRTSLPAKQKIYDELFDAANQRLKNELAGRYRLRLLTAWKDSRGETEGVFETEKPVLDVTGGGREWSVTFFKKMWTGSACDLLEWKLEQELAAVLDDFQGFSRAAALAKGKASVQCPEKKLVLTIEMKGIPRYRPEKEEEFFTQDEAQEFATQVAEELAKYDASVPAPQVRSRMKAFDPLHGGIVFFVPTPAIPGFSRLEPVLCSDR